MQFSSERNDRGQAEGCNLSPNTMQSLLCVNIGQYRAEEPR